MINTINAQEVVALFHQLMKNNTSYRIMYISGQEKLGKTHLVAKLFPEIGKQDYGSYCILIDIREGLLSIPEILFQIAAQLDRKVSLKNFKAAYKNWLNRDKVNIPSIKALFSQVRIHVDSKQDSSKWEVYLTHQLISDIALKPIKFLFLVDQFDNANKATKRWLLETFLVQLCSLENARVVVSGRFVPRISSIYHNACVSYELHPVLTDIEYIRWCRKVGIRRSQLVDQSIRDIMHVVGCRPGLFVDLVLPAYKK